MVLDQTPFYAEGGGQVGDQGVLRDAPTASVALHGHGHPAAGARADRPSRHAARHGCGRRDADAPRSTPSGARGTMRNHTGTHLLHRALRNTVGDQAPPGGLARDARLPALRLPGDRALTDDEKRAIEAEVRRVVRDNRPVTPRYMTMAEAIEEGADAFFDEKYGETGARRLRRWLQPRAVRWHALLRDGPDRRLRDHRRALDRAAACAASRRSPATPRTPTSTSASRCSIGRRRRPARRRRRRSPDRVREMQDARQDARSAARALRRQRPSPGRAGAQRASPSTARSSSSYCGCVRLDGGAQVVRQGRCAASCGDGVIALGLEADEPQLFVTVSDDLVTRGVSAGRARQPRRAVIDGKGGGRPEMAQARGTRRDRLPSALTAIREAERRWRRRSAAAGARPRNGPPGVAFWRRFLQRDARAARRLHGAGHRHGVRQGARLRDRRRRARHRARRRPQAPGPGAHAVGHRRGHRRGGRQLPGRAPGSRGDGRLPIDAR